MYSREELQALVDVLVKYPEVYVISDEIYEHLVYEGAPTCMATFPEIADRVAIVSGVSKGFAMTGWRIGYIYAPEWMAALCEKYQGQITSGANSIAQRAAVAALTGTLTPSDEMRDAFKVRRDMMSKALSEIPGLKSYTPPAAFYFYPDLSGFFGKTTPDGKVIQNIDELTQYLLDDGKLAVIPGSAFGTDNHIRISYAYAEDILQEGLKRLSASLLALK